MKIHCKYDELMNPNDLIDHPKNRNNHGSDQIERLADIYKYQGVRHPIIISKISNFIVAGHCRKLAAIRAGIKQFPVVFQDFESSAQEYTFMNSDNAIALWAELDIKAIKLDLEDFENELDIDLLGIKDFTLALDDAQFDPDFDDEDEKETDEKKSVCPHCGGLL